MIYTYIFRLRRVGDAELERPPPPRSAEWPSGLLFIYYYYIYYIYNQHRLQLEQLVRLLLDLLRQLPRRRDDEYAHALRPAAPRAETIRSKERAGRVGDIISRGVGDIISIWR